MPEILTPRMITDRADIDAVMEFVRRFPLDYPQYDAWLELCKRQLQLGKKNGFYITDQGIVGSIIFQAHHSDTIVMEVKNLRVDPEHCNQGHGALLCQTVEKLAIERGFRGIMVDTHSHLVIDFLEKRGYEVIESADLYKRGQLENVLLKVF